MKPVMKHFDIGDYASVIHLSSLNGRSTVM